MYKKYLSFMFLWTIMTFAAVFSVKGIAFNKILSDEVFQATIYDKSYENINYMNLLSDIASTPRVLNCEVLSKEYIYDITNEDYEVLLRIVEAEAGCEDKIGKLLVANVVLNRVKSELFPNTIKEVVMQKKHGTTQFSPVANKKFYNVEISQDTIDVVERALCGEDISEGALYFASRKYADPERMKWFDTNLTFLFEYGGHEFFS